MQRCPNCYHTRGGHFIEVPLQYRWCPTCGWDSRWDCDSCGAALDRKTDECLTCKREVEYNNFRRLSERVFLEAIDENGGAVE
jgi:predicted amidophosphoribosyltransferase